MHFKDRKVSIISTFQLAWMWTFWFNLIMLSSRAGDYCHLHWSDTTFKPLTADVNNTDLIAVGYFRQQDHSSLEVDVIKALQRSELPWMTKLWLLHNCEDISKTAGPVGLFPVYQKWAKEGQQVNQWQGHQCPAVIDVNRGVAKKCNAGHDQQMSEQNAL